MNQTTSEILSKSRRQELGTAKSEDLTPGTLLLTDKQKKKKKKKESIQRKKEKSEAKTEKKILGKRKTVEWKEPTRRS
jgi:hypothetical protein